MSEVADRYRRLAGAFTEKVEAVPARDARWDQPSPCPDWTARGVIQHMLDTHHMFLGFVDRDVPAGPGTDDPLAAWKYVRDALQAGLDDPQLANQEYDGFIGAKPWETYADMFINSDLVVHAWDLSRALGLDDRLDLDEIRKVRDVAQSFPQEMMRSPGAFGPEVEAPPGADEQDRILAFLGRDPR